MATHATVLTAGKVALSGPAAEIAAHPALMDLFFGDAQSAGSHEADTGGAVTGEAPAGRAGTHGAGIR
jgi:hypothetical protein